MAGHTLTTTTAALAVALPYTASTGGPAAAIAVAAGAAHLAVLAAGCYRADHRQRATTQRLARLRALEPPPPSGLTRQERQALALIAHHLKETA
ncbi:hypothetical protein ACIQPQ_31455 [Streptomyces sp. NPDC091281]|uniref:hypothetical protein n=1 Tax=Streptomyces sp. NPDC091281 TaxID=3365985 RepID=UPI00382E24D0